MAIKFKYVGDIGYKYTPKRETEGASGCDLRNATGKDITIHPRSKGVVGTGICVEIPDGFEGQLRPRSGFATRECAIMLPSIGTIDSDYRGEIKATFFNPTDGFIVIRAGERVAQLVIAPYGKCEYEEAEELTATERGEKGFGSTGR